MTELRITDTNSSNDSKGRAFGLEGNDFIYVLIGLVAGLGFFLLLKFLVHAGLLISLVLALPLFIAPLGWILLLCHNKPDGFAGDWFDQRVNGAGWSQAPFAQPHAPKKDQRA